MIMYNNTIKLVLKSSNIDILKLWTPRANNAEVRCLYASKYLAEIAQYDTQLLQHSVHVAEIASCLARGFDFSESICDDVWLAGALHDYGKLFISDEILKVDKRFDDFEFTVAKGHAAISANILRSDAILDEHVILGVEEHHERDDGSGYPYGKRGLEISIFGRILSAADVFDALTAKRVYKEPMSVDKALNIMREEHFNEEVIAVLQEISNDLSMFLHNV